jgi:peptide/nickel transport system permease protein
MRAYVIRRLLLIIPTLLLVTIIVFFTIRLIPGDVIEIMLAEQVEGASDYNREQLEREMGLDAPIHIQYGRWLGFLPTPDEGFNGIFQGNLGSSLWTNISVTDELKHRLPVSLELGILSLLIGQIIALPIGIYSAIRQDTVGDYIGRSFAIVCIAVPSFWLGTMVMVFPSLWWNWSPPMRYIRLSADPLGNLRMMLIPAVILGMVLSGTTMRMTRTMMLEVLRQDYIRTAWAKGLRERVVVIRHALKNALIPIVTIIGMQLPLLIGGSVIIENIFCLPGVGALMVRVINYRDYTVLSGINLFMATAVLLINLLVDITYSYLDPRVHYK